MGKRRAVQLSSAPTGYEGEWTQSGAGLGMMRNPAYEARSAGSAGRPQRRPPPPLPGSTATTESLWDAAAYFTTDAATDGGGASPTDSLSRDAAQAPPPYDNVNTHTSPSFGGSTTSGSLGRSRAPLPAADSPGHDQDPEDYYRVPRALVGGSDAAAAAYSYAAASGQPQAPSDQSIPNIY